MTSGDRRWLAAVAVTFAVVAWMTQPAGTATAGTVAQPAPGHDTEDPDGRQLYLTGCSSCHGEKGAGTERGPSLKNSGEASAYYYLSTGRMPLADEQSQPRRKEPAYSATEIHALVEYVASLGEGPSLPHVNPANGDLAEGGVLYRSNCAPCHTAAGIGGALSYGSAAPSLHSSGPLQTAAAVRVGPGQMPLFGPEALDREELDSIVRYVQYLRSPPTPGGAALGSAGPIPEGFVAWVFGVGALVLAVLWIGKRQTSRNGKGGHGRS
ncbi:MAG TPA: c-type cytochrome [Acidimicrobiales bacterium]|nr:c-type cytochrome [Acidimicrobiales bacterium]